MKILKTRNEMPGDMPDAETQFEPAKKNILIVDDSGFARKILKDMLEREGYNIAGEAGDGFEAIEMAKELKPDFVFMDVAMPKLDGMGALPRVLEVTPGSKVIMSTAMGQKSIIVEAMKIGAVDYVLKPYKKENIIEVMNAHWESEPKNSQLISFEEEKKHYIKEKTREAIAREVKENGIRKEETETAANNEVDIEAVKKENFKAVDTKENPEADTGEDLYADTNEAVTEVDNEDTSLEAIDEGDSLELSEDEESEGLELSVGEESLELSVGEEGLELSIEEESLDGIAEEDSLVTIADEEIQDSNAEEEILAIDSTPDGLETGGKEESLPAVNEEELQKDITKDQTLKTDPDAESPSAVTVAKDEIAKTTSVQDVPEFITNEAAAAKAPGIITEEVATPNVSTQDVPETNTQAVMPETVLDTESAVGNEKEPTFFSKGEYNNIIAETRNTEADIQNSNLSYLWKNRFDARHEDNFAHRSINEGNDIRNFCGLSNNGNNLSEEENSEQNMMFDLVNAYMDLNSRFDNETVVGKYIFKPYGGIRLATSRVFGSEWYCKDEISLSNILKYSNFNNSQDRVYFEKNSFYYVVMHLVQGKADRILGQDRIKISVYLK
ncbi:MAG: response regulator [Anaerocolumna sp.]